MLTHPGNFFRGETNAEFKLMIDLDWTIDAGYSKFTGAVCSVIATIEIKFICGEYN